MALNKARNSPKRGRPKTRVREDLLYWVWETVRIEIESGRAGSEQHACELLDAAGTFMRVFSVSGERVPMPMGDTVRQWVETAKTLRKQPGKFPMLAARCDLFERVRAPAIRKHALTKQRALKVLHDFDAYRGLKDSAGAHQRLGEALASIQSEPAPQPPRQRRRPRQPK